MSSTRWIKLSNYAQYLQNIVYDNGHKLIWIALGFEHESDQMIVLRYPAIVEFEISKYGEN